MIDDKEHRKLTWEYYEKERERIKIEIKKKNILQLEKDNQTLIYLRNIPIEDIQKSFNEYYNDNNLDNIQLKAIVSLAYLTKADFSVLDVIDIKDISKVNKDNALEKFLTNLKDSLNIKENSNNNIRHFNLLKSNLQSWLNELEKQKIIEGQLLTSIEGKKIIKSSSQRTHRYTLNEYLQSISEFQPHKDNDTPLHKLDIQFLKRNNINKKIDYLAYEKKAVDGKLKQSELFEADIKELDITNPEQYLDGISGKKTGIETEDKAKIKSTDLSFTGHTNLYNPKDKKLISSKTFIRGDLVDYTKCKYYDSSCGFLEGGKKVTTPKFETIYLANGKKFSEFERENHIFDFGHKHDLMPYEVYPVAIPKGLIRIFDNEGNIQQSYYRKGNTIIPYPNPEKKLSSLYLRKNYYSVILYDDELGVIEGEDSVGFGDPEFIYADTMDGHSICVDHFFNKEFKIVIASFNFLDELSSLFFLDPSLAREYQEVQTCSEAQKNEIYNSLFSINIDDKFKIPSNHIKKHQLLAELNFIEFDTCLDKDKKLFGIHEQELKSTYLGDIPIVSKEIFISGLGTFDCKNGWYELYHKDIDDKPLSKNDLKKTSRKSDSPYYKTSIHFLLFSNLIPINKNQSDKLIKKARKYFKEFE